MVRHELANVLALRGKRHSFQSPAPAQDIGALIKAHPGPTAMAHALPADWTHMLAATGTPDEFVESIRAMAAGANSIAPKPLDTDRAEHQLELFARGVLPPLRN